MAVYNVYLGTPYRRLPFNVYYSPIRFTLERWFQKVVQLLPKELGFTEARVQYTSRVPNLNPRELLIYLVESPQKSLWKAFTGNALPDLGGELMGYTIPIADQFGAPLLSEVYLRDHVQNPLHAAALAFHEAMHNASNNTMSHGVGGPLSREDPRGATDATIMQDILLMYLWISRGPPRQWTKGLETYQRADFGDCGGLPLG